MLSQWTLWAPIATPFTQDVLPKADCVLHSGLDVVNGDEGASLAIFLSLGFRQFDSHLEGYFNVSAINYVS